jgi:hypothetical protein
MNNVKEQMPKNICGWICDSSHPSPTTDEPHKEKQPTEPSYLLSNRLSVLLISNYGVDASAIALR